MYDIITALINQLNLIEVKGQTNLALLYNSIDTLKQLQTAFKPKVEEVTKTEEVKPNAAEENTVNFPPSRLAFNTLIPTSTYRCR